MHRQGGLDLAAQPVACAKARRGIQGGAADGTAQRPPAGRVPNQGPADGPN